MTPTPAQIEAAAKAIIRNNDCPLPLKTARALAETALTAAAEVGEESTMEHIARDIKAGIFPRKSEPPLDAATIERCAQVADSRSDPVGDQIAEAIRTLKDK